MKISFQWLSEYIDLEDYRGKVEELGKILTAAGLEVEDIHDPSVNWDKVVIGKILKKEKHENADKLTVCQVDIGGQTEQIVCGAKNHNEGDFVVVATPGAVLPGDFKIKKSKIRGVESSGMLCSEKEMGLSEESDGIMILSDQPKTGTAFADYAQAGVVFELNVTPNRADCLSHIGLARELSTLLDRPIKKPDNAVSEGGDNIDKAIKVELKDPKGCPRYCGRMIKGVKVGPSPGWLRQRLESVGVNSINNIVDVTNYVLFEYGQPLHAFDYAHIKNQVITIEKAKKGEKFTTLDGTEVELSTDDLLIRDGERGVALAGVVGGLNSGVSETTQDIFLESAFFSAEGVRRTSRSHGIETDSCYRFSRGVDPVETLNAMDRAAHLIIEVAGGQVQKNHVDLYPEPLVFSEIKIKTSYVSERVGYPVTDSDFSQWMERLGCKVTSQDGEFRVIPPSFRWDLRIPEDLVEEYARLNGYDKIEETLPDLESEPAPHVAQYSDAQRVAQILGGLGCYQAVNYAFIGPGLSQKIWGSSEKASQFGLKVVEADSAVEIMNPISADMKVMRESLLPGLLANTIHNNHHGVNFGRIFEIGPSHFKDEKGCGESQHLALAFWGEPEGLWHQAHKDFVVYSLKATIEALLTKIGGKSWRWQQVDASSCPPGFHPGQTAALVYEGKAIGLLGTIHPLIKEDNKIRTNVAWAELDFAKLMSRQPRAPKFSEVPKFPGVERDIALVAPEELAAEEIGAQIKKTAGPLLENYRVFDVYQDKDLKAAGRRSIAFRLRFQSPKETLADEQINQLRDKIVNSICQKLPVESR